jgi:DNA-binding NarL/FixJ family response regulator
MNTAGHRTRVQVQHADPVVSAGLRFALKARFDIALCNDSKNGADLVICDYNTALELVRQAPMDAHARPVPVLVFTEQDREQAIRHALQAGVHGYVLCSIDIESLVSAVQTVALDRRFLSAEVARRMDGRTAHDALTPREVEVLQLLAQGLANKEVSRLLGITPGTVKTHVATLIAKLGATSRMQAVSLAAQRGLVTLEPCSLP